MGDCTTATKGIILTRESEVGIAVIFRDALERVSLDSDAFFSHVVSEQVCAFFEHAGLEFVDAFITGQSLAGDCLSMGLCRDRRS
ncbi:hypothetical protein [Haladaptatus pallidirubidus]|uniref:Uncharacterized protein n=2 Tax=Haladaptatus pallidirubidus TaxID=1008152 RepID=A0AAV3US18_9EURY|nr:hypothetical protein [Haladaptatus pallidirubidus]